MTSFSTFELDGGTARDRHGNSQEWFGEAQEAAPAELRRLMDVSPANLKEAIH